MDIFGAKIGALNLAPIKISGQYKIVVNLDDDLFLDNYSGRRTKIDKSLEFLPQVAKFLSVSTSIDDTNNQRYGAFHKSNNKYYHIPLYLGNEKSEYPKYFVLSRVVNETINNSDFLYKYGKIQKVLDLEKLGLHKIFDEIFAEDYFEYPLYFNWEEGTIKIFGYDITKDSSISKKIDLTNYQANQTYFDVFNNILLNKFVDNNIFFPKFINLEFEFSYTNEYSHFNNFYGYLSYSNEINKIDMLDNKFYIKSKEFSNKFESTQITNTKEFILEDYEDLLGNGSIQEIYNKEAQIRFRSFKINVNDKISIIHPNGDTEFDYIVDKDDIINTSLYQSFINVCRNATKKSGRKFIFNIENVNNRYCIIKIIWNNIDKFDEGFSVNLPVHYTILDRFENQSNFNMFRGIKNTDVWLCGSTNIFENIINIKINDEYYQINEQYLFDDLHILRLNREINISSIIHAEIYEEKTEKIIELNPINFYGYFDDFKCLVPYDQQKYIDELKEKFVGDFEFIDDLNDLQKSSLTAITSFGERQEPHYLQYVKENESELEDTNVIENIYHNNNKVLDISFNLPGSTAYLTPNILNINKQFYIQNGNLDFNKLDKDNLRFDWFLIKGNCPDYLKNDIRSSRYFTDKPQITSRLIKTSYNKCETVFLGVKYFLPSKYENYQFAIYLDFTNMLDVETSYGFIIDDLNQEIYLTINKYLDFVDLLRGGNINNDPILDLSFLYNATKSYNTNSDNLDTFKTGGIQIVPKLAEGEFILFNTQEVFDWKIYSDGKWYIALKREFGILGGIGNFRLMFPDSGDAILYVYSNIRYQENVYTYISMTITVKGIKYLEDDYLWCEDVSIKFFDTKEIFLKKYNEFDEEEIFYVEKDKIYNYENSSENIFGDFVKIGTILIDGNEEKFKLLLPDKEINFKEYYFRLNQKVIYTEAGTKTIIKEVFKFPEFLRPDFTDTDFFNQFGINSDYEYTIDLFDRNQVWKTSKDIIRYDLKFKELFEGQVRKMINELMVTSLKDYADFKAIPVKNKSVNIIDEYISIDVVDIDRNISIWDYYGVKKVSLFNRQSGPYYPYLKPYQSEINFQLPEFKINQSLFNIYDVNFGGRGINATGLWNEVTGNIVSSLFCKDKNIELKVLYSKSIDYKKLLIQFLNIEDCIINNKNIQYIEKINQNIDQYIIESYADYLLDNFYRFEYVIDNDNKKLKYSVDKKNKNLIHIKNESKELIFVFKRK